MSSGPLLIDVAGLRLDAADRERLRHPLVGGVILFARNFESQRQIAQLVRDIRAARETPLLVTVDHEGGRVQRFRDEFSAIPRFRELGEDEREDRFETLDVNRDLKIDAADRAGGADR